MQAGSEGSPSQSRDALPKRTAGAGKEYEYKAYTVSKRQSRKHPTDASAAEGDESSCPHPKKVGHRAKRTASPQDQPPAQATAFVPLEVSVCTHVLLIHETYFRAVAEE